MIYLVQRGCGDYYCGCGGGHVILATPNKDLASYVAGRGDKVTEIPVGQLRWNPDDYENRAWT